MRIRRSLFVRGLVLAAFAASSLLAACGSAGTGLAGGQIQVVASENFWGSIASQLGGSHVSVTSVVTDPNVDPHEYQSSTTDARAFAIANYVVLNGAGYDDWAQQLLSANETSSRMVLNVAELVGKKSGDNPHFWYAPAYVRQVIDRMTTDYTSIDPADRSTFDQLHASVVAALQPYMNEIATIAQHDRGVKVASTESVFAYMAQALQLDLVSPPAFMDAVSEGNDPPAGAVAQFQQQIANKQASLLVYNTQTVTSVTSNIRNLANAASLPVVGISETLQPPGTTFQSWQLAQLQALQRALVERAGG